MMGEVKHGGLPVRTEDLHRRDQVLLFGQLVEVMDVQAVREFPTTVNLVIRPLPGGTPRETLVPRGMELLGLSVRRLVRLPCVACGRPMAIRVDLAMGTPRRALCDLCAVPVAEGTLVLPLVAPVGRR
ncbi:hypothetical protein [Micromonospora sp. WMMD1082]|uniref:hypothetical protein n=1 Tax=Micromonospora sp. WMMD1082 TaxID=3016104 RepID=UPI0024159AA2|nr:hypothetical protein [Micromonospora sp. WMMD1082]MDG4796949.1 hypothetical protein [Micromonospora sp. WMMD1082]